ncbi:MAG: hypothetical protein ACK4YF_08040, partial [Exilispira sp.]
MQRIFNILIFTLILVLLISVNIFAMPPHPEYLKKLASEGQLNKIITRMNIQKKMGIDNSVKTFPNVSSD